MAEDTVVETKDDTSSDSSTDTKQDTSQDSRQGTRQPSGRDTDDTTRSGATVPSGRLREETARRQQAEQVVEQLQTRIDDFERRMRAFAGVDDSTADEDPQVAALRSQLEKLYPGLKVLRDQSIEQVIAKVQGLESGQNDFWTTHGERAMQAIYSRFKGDTGNEPGRRTQKMLWQGFIDFLEEDETAARLNRYATGDESLIGEFFSDVDSGFVGPYRQKATETAANRSAQAARYPRGGGGQQTRVTGKPKETPKDWDALEKALKADPRLG